MADVSCVRIEELLRSNLVFDEIAAAVSGYVPLSEDGRPHMVSAEMVTANFFAMLGAQSILGHVFRRDEEIPGHDDR